MSTSTVEGFSVSDAKILTGTQGGSPYGEFATAGEQDVYGVREGSLTIDTGDYDNTGDDAVLSSWFWFNYANLSIQGGYIPFTLLASLYGTTISSSGTAPNDYYSVPMWNKNMLNQPTKPVLVRVPSKDSNAAVRNLDIVLYKAQFQPFTLDGPTYKDGLRINYTARCLLSAVDEAGNTLSEAAIGRLVSRP